MSTPPLSPSQPGTPSRPLTLLAGALVLAAVFSFAFTPLRASQDEWWHLKAGQWIVEHRALPVNDIFTYAGEQMRWYNHEWLSQVIFYLAWLVGAGESTGAGAEVGGVQALVTFKAVVVTATFFLLAWLARVRCGSWPVALLVALLAADISRRTIYPRPPIFSYFLMTAFLAVFTLWKMGRLKTRWLWLLVPATVVWGNLHGMVLLAIVVTGAFAAGEAMEAAVARKTDRFPIHIRHFVLLSLLTAAVIVAAMAQPSGWHLFFLGRNFTADPILQRVIGEMLPPPPLLTAGTWWNPATWSYAGPLTLTFWISIPLLLGLLLGSRFRLPYAADYLLTGFFLYQAVNHWRLLPLYAIAAAGPLAWLLARALQRLPGRATAALSQYAVLLLACVLAVWFIFGVKEPVSFFRRNVELVRGNVMDLGAYPRPMMDFILRARLPDRMISEINYIGYPIWRLSPERHKVFTDNRFDLFGSRFYVPERVVFLGAERGDLFMGRPVSQGWQEILDQYGVNFIVTARGNDHLIAKLRRSDLWKPIYYYIPPGADPVSGGYSIWLRNRPEHEEIFRRAETIFAEMHGGAPPPAEFERMVEERR